jgi:hypothetical protein
MLKVIIIIALLIGAFWYFQPEKFDNTVTAIKQKIGWDKAAEETTEQANITSATTTETTTTETTTTLSQGYCFIDEDCQFVSSQQCPDVLYEGRGACEAAYEINETQPIDNGLDYVGFPLDEYSLPYDCMSDNDCRHDNSNCNSIECQCDYSTGECYRI